MDREDPRQLRSRTALLATATRLLDERDPDQITITELVALAGVSRPTFYQHFGDPGALYRDAALARIEQQFELVHPPADATDWRPATHSGVASVLAHMHEHSSFYRRVLRGPSGLEFAAGIIRFVSTRLLDLPSLGARLRESSGVRADDRGAVLAAGVVWLIAQWLSSDFTGDDSVAAMTDRVTDLLVTMSSKATS